MVCGCLKEVYDKVRLCCLQVCYPQAWLGERSYWDAAYASGKYRDKYEWLQTCDVIWPYLEEVLGTSTNSKILHVGCGNSRLGRQLHDRGFVDVTNVDYSAVVIDMMRQKEPDLCWVKADCTQPGALGVDEYDVCVDKGALDSLFEAGSNGMRKKGGAMVAEVHRALRPGGCYLLFSNAALGAKALQEHFASVEMQSIEGYSCDLYYKLLYVICCKK